MKVKQVNPMVELDQNSEEVSMQHAIHTQMSSNKAFVIMVVNILSYQSDWYVI